MWGHQSHQQSGQRDQMSDEEATMSQGHGGAQDLRQLQHPHHLKASPHPESS